MPETLTVVVPVYNETAVLEAFHQRLGAVLADCDIECQVLYVDDGSDPDCLALLQRLRDQDARVAVLELSRNFGREVAVSAGLDHVDADAVVVLDADLQDPPELIPQFIEQWRSGYDVVYGKRIERRGESALKRCTASAFYSVLGYLSDVEIPRNVGDFRLLSRRAVAALTSLPERHRYMKGLYAWIGFPQKGIEYVRAPRAAGKSKWTYWRLWNFALDGITSFSAVPLKAATYLGLLTSTLAFMYGAYLLVRTLFFGNPVPGYPSLIIVVLFLGGVQLICLGIIGEYLARTYQESKGRALYFLKGYHPAGGHSADTAD
ncbi:glycosyltransferase family 2 protein [Pseudohalioglobus lutimaris]|uniref:Glycosyltransferase n=1 Tax=Pseudohalioglobus lutimaris TaxID=1737061 RepID=A0A2N5WX45_9GAMM|nr:glycosyltransferase family 2 protein [Pseudohalioglobus lutimaris]PLW66811.1 glycosyltransferase [Pseudohalioglobus lutimaris]